MSGVSLFRIRSRRRKARGVKPSEVVLNLAESWTIRYSINHPARAHVHVYPRDVHIHVYTRALYSPLARAD